ncbi:AtpZ/AtpI family protein [Thermaerobacter subterraneus]|uniref:F0F1-ATPase subunit (ATPase_gene1) n=1 Tax=Thermaerobacter subterraneus DSM 13965 TaxID=867903 RepID=K6PP33_9FIRM|nr:AtpZ/AtpI family protein [Thermaerobacter subterraneus]EKP94667.1 hypothetical protein ThesuDRAFT_02408 [Thermaerobacter subterraneus DSM 13965]
MAGESPSRPRRPRKAVLPPRKATPPGARDRSGRAWGGSGNGLRGAGTLFELAFTFAGTLLAGMAIGYYGGRWLDGWLDTAPWLQLLGLMLGVVAAFRVLWRTLQRLDADEPAAGGPGRGHGGAGMPGRGPGAAGPGSSGSGPDASAGREVPRHPAEQERGGKGGPSS